MTFATRLCFGFILLFSSLVPASSASDWSSDEVLCWIGNADSCHEIGLKLYNSEDEKAEATPYFERACSGDKVESCLFLATMYRIGDGIARDSNQAASFFERACALGSAGSCNEFGILIVDEDIEELSLSTTYFERACEGGHPEGCHNLGLAYLDGIGIPVDFELANANFERGCSSDIGNSCGNLSVSYGIGRGAISNSQTAFEYATKGCDLDDMASCVLKGHFFEQGIETNGATTHAVSAFVHACDNGSPQGCQEAGRMYAEGKFIEQDLQQALQYFDISCDRGVRTACSDLEVINAVQQVPENLTRDEVTASCDRYGDSYCIAINNHVGHCAILSFDNPSWGTRLSDLSLHTNVCETSKRLVDRGFDCTLEGGTADHASRNYQVHLYVKQISCERGAEMITIEFPRLFGLVRVNRNIKRNANSLFSVLGTDWENLRHSLDQDVSTITFNCAVFNACATSSETLARFLMDNIDSISGFDVHSERDWFLPVVTHFYRSTTEYGEVISIPIADVQPKVQLQRGAFDDFVPGGLQLD